MSATEAGTDAQGRVVTVTFRPTGDTVTKTTDPATGQTTIVTEKADGSTSTATVPANESGQKGDIERAVEIGAISEEQAAGLNRAVNEAASVATNQEVAGVVEIGNALKWGMIAILLIIVVVLVALNYS